MSLRSRIVYTVLFGMQMICPALVADTAKPCRYIAVSDRVRVRPAGGDVTLEIAADPSFFDKRSSSRYTTTCPIEFEPAEPWLTVVDRGFADENGHVKFTVHVTSNETSGARSAAIRVGTLEGLRRFPQLPQENKVIVIEQDVSTGPGRMGINSGGAVNNASFVAQLSPGTLFSIFGTNMATTTVNGFALPLPTSSNGTTVRVNGIAAPLLYLSPNQINAQVPMEVQPGTGTVTVVLNSVSSSATVNITLAAPGLYMSDFKTRAVFQRLDGTPLSVTNPAIAGDGVVFYGTGVGPVSPPVPTGAPAQGGNNVSHGTLPVQLTIGGINAPVDFLGLTPGFAGLMQVNGRVPSSVPTSDSVPVVVSINGVPSQTAFISVRNPGSPGSRPTVNSFGANPSSIQAGQSTTLSWNVSNATTVVIDNGFGAVSSIGSRVVMPGSSVTYTLTASNSSGSVTAFAAVNVASVQLPSITQFSADSTSLTTGQSTTLRWATINATSVTIDNGIGSVGASGNRTIAPSSNTTYTLVASNTAGSQSATVTVVISPPNCQLRGGSPVWNSDIVQFTGDLSNGMWHLEGFSVTGTLTLVLKNVSDYANQVAIITPDQVNNFENGNAFTGFAIFDGINGLHTVTLSTGQYYVGARYFGNGTTHMRFELDGLLQVPGASFVDYYLDHVDNVPPNGGTLVQPFTISPCTRYFLDGANAGTEFYVIAASEIDNFKNGRPFLFYINFSGPNGGVDEDQPDDSEITLPPGDYALAYRNPAGNAKSVVYVMSRWQ